MIYFGFKLINPFFGRFDKDTKNYFYVENLFTKNKFFEFQFSGGFDCYHLLDFSLDFRWRGHDHAGFEVDFGLLGISLNIAIRDKRHWNYDTNAWYTEQETKEEFETYERKLLDKDT